MNRIEKTMYSFNECKVGPLLLMIPDIAEIETVSSKEPNEYWFNILYPQYQAVVYCTYLPITEKNYSAAIEDSYHLAYSHALKADGINQIIYNSPKLGGIIYEIEGDVATPFQFFITDSTKNFLRGSFYYTHKVDTDSVSPITDFVKEDIEYIFNTIRFDTQK